VCFVTDGVMSDDSGTEEGWNCEVCRQSAVDSGRLEFQLLPGDRVILSDADGRKWLFCRGCHAQFHLDCVSNLPKNVVDEDFGGDYFCGEICGMFMQGAYT
jgi:hypothetical protein